MDLKLNKSTLILILFLHASFISISYINNYKYIRYIILLIVGFYLLLHFKTFINSKFTKLNIVVMLYVICLLFTSYLNRNLPIERKVFLVSIVQGVTLLEGFYLFEYFYLKNKTKNLINVMFYVFLFYIIVTDIILLLLPNLYIEKGYYYLIGNKFSVSFNHLLVLILYLQRHNKSTNLLNFSINDLPFYSLLLLGIVISIIVECSTVIVGFLIFLIIYFAKIYNKRFFNKFSTFVITLSVSTFILLLFSSLVEIPFVRYFIEEILHEDITLTGRMNIYEQLGVVLKDHVLFGYGVGSSYEVTMLLIHAPNLQNGVLNFIVEQGIISLVIFLLAIYIMLQNTLNKRNNYLLIYMFILVILSSVEITIGHNLLLWFLLYYLNNINDLNCHNLS